MVDLTDEESAGSRRCEVTTGDKVRTWRAQLKHSKWRDVKGV